MSLISVHSGNAEIFVLDAWPFLERALRSASLQRFDRLLELAARSEVVLFLSEMNLGEIFYLLSKQKSESMAEAAIHAISQAPIHVQPVLSGDVLKAARLKARYPLSYADCFCAGLAMQYGARVVTGDPDFLELERSGLLGVEWVGA